MDLAPENADFHYQVATHLLELKRYKEAIEHYRRITVLEPAVPGGYTNVGMALDAAGQYEGALKAYREALRLKPAVPCRTIPSLVRPRAGRCTEAVAAFEKADRLCRDCFEPGEMAAYQDCYNRTHR